MGRKIIDKTGEINYNTFGSKMIIKTFRGQRDIDVYFPEYDWLLEHTSYKCFKKGNIKCPYEPRTFNMGYIGEGSYEIFTNKTFGKHYKLYSTWHDMIGRCYNPKWLEKRPTYKDSEVHKEWLNLQNYGKWFEDNYYEIPNETMHLDKDILIKGNKIYSPETCIFVPQRINNLFVKCEKKKKRFAYRC